MSDCWLCCAADTAAYAVAVLFLVALIRSYVRGGFKAVVAQFVSALRAAVPGLNTLITVLIFSVVAVRVLQHHAREARAALHLARTRSWKYTGAHGYQLPIAPRLPLD